MSYRIGIDVGGTFTHAVALDTTSLTVTHQAKVPTTHRAAEGVALGVTQALQALLTAGVAPSAVTFIAHSTTQATNALLEGDVSTVGILGMARGGDALKARADTEIGRLEIAPGRFLDTTQAFLESTTLTRDRIRATVEELRAGGAQVIVAAEAFGVDDPTHERLVLEVCAELGLPATASHEVSGLYGLRIRTRTAAINASILPRMMLTAQMTAQAVQAAGITAPLMIMRSDGGVMSIEEMRRRPILTILSGPAAGVAAALMYARISDGLFLEVGGTSTDITCIRNGQAAIRSATVGGHKLFLRTLDVRTIGLAGGSMVRMRDGRISGVGPRSAHLAGLAYSCFMPPPTEPAAPTVTQSAPLPNDPAEYLIADDAGTRYAFTMTCAANAAGVVPAGDYATGDARRFARYFTPTLNRPAQEAAELVLTAGCAQAVAVVEELLREYGVTREHATLIGGGGGAAAVVPYTGKLMHLPWRTAENAPVISAIGVALALVRDSVERTIPHPTKEDLLRLRQEAVAAVVKVGANPDTVEVQVEVDPQHQVVRATATGATELRTRDLAAQAADPTTQRLAAARSLDLPDESVHELARSPFFAVFSGPRVTRRLFGLLTTRRTPVRVVDREGVIRLQLVHGTGQAVPIASALPHLRDLMAAYTHYSDGGERLPGVFLLAGPRLFNLSGLLTAEHVLSLADAELQHLPADEAVVLVVGEG
jgi:N-methylhydantoinase A